MAFKLETGFNQKPGVDKPLNEEINKTEGGKEKGNLVAEKVNKLMLFVTAFLAMHSAMAQESHPETKEMKQNNLELINTIKSDTTQHVEDLDQRSGLKYVKAVKVSTGENGEAIYAMAGEGYRGGTKVVEKIINPSKDEITTMEFIDNDSDGTADVFQYVVADSKGNINRAKSSNGHVFRPEIRSRLEVNDINVPRDAFEIINVTWQEALELIAKNKGEKNILPEEILEIRANY